jgi:hypothetical protein
MSVLVPLQRKEHRIAVEQEWIVVRCYHLAKKDWVTAMKISPAMLPDASD